MLLFYPFGFVFLFIRVTSFIRICMLAEGCIHSEYSSVPWFGLFSSGLNCFDLFCFFLSLCTECFHSFCSVSSFFSLWWTWVVDFDTDFLLNLFLSYLKLSCLPSRAVMWGLWVAPVSSSVVSGDGQGMELHAALAGRPGTSTFLRSQVPGPMPPSWVWTPLPWACLNLAQWSENSPSRSCGHRQELLLPNVFSWLFFKLLFYHLGHILSKLEQGVEQFIKIIRAFPFHPFSSMLFLGKLSMGLWKEQNSSLLPQTTSFRLSWYNVQPLFLFLSVDF